MKTSALQSWLDGMKKQAISQMPKKQPNYFAIPVRSRYMGNTGTGNNNVLEPDKPVDVMSTDQGPRLLHEGEQKWQAPDGTMSIVPAGRTAMPQDKLQKMQNQGVPGFAPDKPVDVMSTDQGPRLLHEGEQKWQAPDGTMSIVPAGRTAMPQDKLQKMQNQGVPGFAGGATDVAGTTSPTPSTSPTSTPTQIMSGASGTAAPVFDAPAATIPTPTQTTTQPTVTGTPPTTTTPSTGVTTPTTTPTPAGTTTTPSASGYYYDAMGMLKEVAKGGSPALQTQNQKTLDDLKATQGVQEKVAGFENAQQGVSKEVASARGAMGRAVAGSQLANATAQTNIGQMQSAEQAQKDLAQAGIAGVGMEATKMQTAWSNIDNMMKLDPYGKNTDAIVKAASDAGININPQTLTDAGSRAQLSATMSMITTAAQTGLSAEETKELLNSVGLGDFAGKAFSGTGGLEGVIGKVNTNTNPIDKAISEYENSAAYKSLPPEDQKKYDTLFKQVQLNPNFMTVDAQGNVHFGQPGTSISGGTIPTTGAGSQPGQYYVSNGQITQNKDGVPTTVNASDLGFNDLYGMSAAEKSQVLPAVLAKTPETSAQSIWNDSKGLIASRELVNVTVNGQQHLARVTGTASVKGQGSWIAFQDPDGTAFELRPDGTVHTAISGHQTGGY